jgi:hypothetical protein
MKAHERIFGIIVDVDVAIVVIVAFVAIVIATFG